MTSPTSNTDAEDVRRTLSGDHEAFGRLYDRHAARVRAVVAAVSCDWNAVEDLTQETFLRAHKRLATLHRRDGFGPWISGVARRVARERRRTRRRDRHQYQDLSDGLLLVDGNDRLQHEETRHAVMAAVAELPERERLAVHSYFFAEQRAGAAAEALGLSRSGFYALLNRALSRLRTRLACAGPDSPGIPGSPGVPDSPEIEEESDETV